MSDDLVLSSEPTGGFLSLSSADNSGDTLTQDETRTVADFVVAGNTIDGTLASVTEGRIGPMGLQGPPGPPGAAATGIGASPSVYYQPVASEVWQFTHTYPYRPIVETYTNDGEEILGDESFPSSGVVRVTFGFPMTGSMTLR